MNRREALRVMGLGTFGLVACSRSIGETPDKAAAAPISSEKAVEPGWMRFRSINSPYQIDYPSGWTAQSQPVISGKAVDQFSGDPVGFIPTIIKVTTENVQPWVTTDDYSQNAFNEASQQLQLARQGAGGVVITSVATKIADQKAFYMRANIPANASIIGKESEFRGMFFVGKGKGWQISLSCPTSVINKEESLFEKMLSSFKFLA